MNRGALWAIVHGVPESRTQLSNIHTTHIHTYIHTLTYIHILGLGLSHWGLVLGQLLLLSLIALCPQVSRTPAVLTKDPGQTNAD